jgi:hypothetical protein
MADNVTYRVDSSPYPYPGSYAGLDILFPEFVQAVLLFCSRVFKRHGSEKSGTVASRPVTPCIFGVAFSKYCVRALS